MAVLNQKVSKFNAKFKTDNSKTKTRDSKSNQRSKIFRIALVAFFLYTTFTCAAIQVDISQRKETIETIKLDLEYQEFLNSQFLSALESGSDTEYIINIAREKLGFVFPDERVFIDPNRKQ